MIVPFLLTKTYLKSELFRREAKQFWHLSPFKGYYSFPQPLSLSRLIQQTTNCWLFSYFSRKQDLTFHANCLQWRQFAWNVKTCFLGKIKIFSKCHLLKVLPKVLNIKVCIVVLFYTLQIFSKPLWNSRRYDQLALSVLSLQPGSVQFTTDWWSGCVGFNPCWVWQHSFVGLNHEIFSSHSLTSTDSRRALEFQAKECAQGLVNRIED